MHELRNLFSHQLRVALCVVALGALVPVQVVQAQEVADPAFNRFRSQVIGNTVNFSYGTGGSPLGGAGNATGIGVSSGVDVSRGVNLSTKHGPINGSLTQKISSNAMGKAFARAAGYIGGPVGLAFLALPAIVEWMSDAGVQHGNDGFTSLSELPAGYDGYEYREQNQTGPTWYKTRQLACEAHAAATYGGPDYYYTCGALAPISDWQYFTVQLRFNSGGIINTQDRLFVRRTDPSPPVQQQEPLTNEQLGDRMGAIANPSPEALAELYKLAAPLNLSHPIPDLVDTLRAEFEARSPETTETSSTDTPSETKTEQKTCATYTQLLGSTVTLVEECETTTTTQAKDPETGLPIGAPTTTTTTSSSTAPDPATKEEQQDPCINAPNRVACLELGTPEGDIPKSTRSVDFEPEELFGGGTCPSDQSFTFRSTTLPITNYAQACDLLETYVRPMAILLAFFAAMMILARGMPV